MSGGPGWQSWDILAARLSKSRQVQASGPRRLPQVLKAPGKAPEVWCTHRSTWLCYASQALQIGCTYRKSSSNIQAPSLNALKDTICLKGHNVGTIWKPCRVQMALCGPNFGTILKPFHVVEWSRVTRTDWRRAPQRDTTTKGRPG